MYRATDSGSDGGVDHSRRVRGRALLIISATLAVAMSGCGGQGSSAPVVIQRYTIGGTVSGLDGGESVTVVNSDTGDSLTIGANSSFAFADSQPSGAAYSVAVTAHTPGITCAISNLSGTVASQNVTNIFVACSAGSETILSSFQDPNPDGAYPGGLITDGAGNFYGTTVNGGTYNAGTVFKVDSAGTETILYSFRGGTTDGSQATIGPVMDSAGNLYGATSGGGASGDGTVFKVDPAGTETILHSFGSSGIDDVGAEGLVVDGAGNLYGTTAVGGTHNDGVLFKIDPAGTYTVLYSFGGVTNDGINPGGLVLDAAGNLYGTTSYGGAYNFGAVFEITPAGVETLLYSFKGGTSDGSQPLPGMIKDGAGDLYGTTSGGGAHGDGTVFKVGPSGTETILYSFQLSGANGGTPPNGVILDSAGNLYGTDVGGGTSGCGTVFQINSVGVETVLYSFKCAADDGSSPTGGLVIDGAGNLRGTTSQGGTFGYGTVFEIDGAGTETVLHFFKGSTGYGVGPVGIVVGSVGNLYGVTSGGGTSNGGTVFRIDASGTETVVHSFQNFVTTLNGPGDGAQPTSIITDGAGDLYGTTAYGGTYGFGTVFKIDAGGGTEAPLYSFQGATPDTSSDGSGPVALIRDSAGNFYGTTATGGGYNAGTVFKVDPAGTEAILYSFGSTSSDDGIIGPLVVDGSGNIYATTQAGGADNFGAIFKINPAGAETVFYSFTDQGSDGAFPGEIITDGAGNLYGITASGGAYNYGMVFKLDPSGAKTVLYSFKGGTADGSTPTGLIKDSAGNFYGTTANGGAYGNGTVFQLTSAGTETILYSFRGGTVDGSGPTTLVMDAAGNLYGTTPRGGALNYGVVFEIN